MQSALFELLLRLGDDHLVLGHRVSEWCGHAPMLEEDLAMPNMGLDMIGQARSLYTYAGEVEGKGRTEDDFAYFRSELDYRNLLLVERPNGDFAHTMLRQLYFAAFMTPYWKAMQTSTDDTLAGIAGKAEKEVAYHIRHAGEWVIRLGDGTEESAKRMQAAVAALHPYTEELFQTDAVTDTLAEAGVAPDPAAIRPGWTRTIDGVFTEARLEKPEIPYPYSGGRQGLHGEALGHMLAEMQSVQRANPGLTW
jgi:ring-1,2-phenylacetyl-CoA epoxidase subunit PaaC